MPRPRHAFAAHDDDDVLPSRRPAPEGAAADAALSLFAPSDAPGGFATRPAVPPAPAEQQGLGLPGSIDHAYARWRATPEGQAAYTQLATWALEEVAQGATRISISRLVERYRFLERKSINNNFRALLSRELERDHPVLVGLIEQRVRTAAS